MTGRLPARAKTDMTPLAPLTGGRTAQLPGDPASRSYYPNRGPAMFR